MWGEIAQAGLSLAGSMGSANASSALSKSRYKYLKQAYENMLKKAGNDFESGESAFLNEANTQLPELEMMENDIANQNATALNNASNQIRSNLAVGGVRGGQAGTLQNRAMANMGVDAQRDLNNLKFNEANQRAVERRNYQQNKASQAQATSYQLPNF